ARPFRLPGVHVLAYLGFLSSNLIVYWSGWDIVWKLMIAVLIGYVVLGVHEGRFHRFTPKLEWRSGAWVIVWLAGLTLISWLGIYPEEHPAGNISVLGFGWSIIVLAVFSALVMWMATALRLPAETAKQHLSEPVSLQPEESGEH
ncbi:MAG TPA: amino acid permease, partial [Rhodanobacteraceae bacterium]|nr:amino acid permease [Rhodanobacteraceae bacterium]